jgi:hypothetical protein
MRSPCCLAEALAVQLRMTWIAAMARADLLRHCHVEIIAGRLKMLPPGARDRGHGGTTDFSWFIMRREIVQATRLVRGYERHEHPSLRPCAISLSSPAFILPRIKEPNHANYR